MSEIQNTERADVQTIRDALNAIDTDYGNEEGEQARCGGLVALDSLAAALREADGTCAVCGHGWRQHDPEDGRCDAHSEEPGIFGPCECGRDLAWMNTKIAGLSRAALRASTGRDGE